MSWVVIIHLVFELRYQPRRCFGWVVGQVGRIYFVFPQGIAHADKKNENVATVAVLPCNAVVGFAICGGWVYMLNLSQQGKDVISLGGCHLHHFLSLYFPRRNWHKWCSHNSWGTLKSSQASFSKFSLASLPSLYSAFIRSVYSQ